MTDERQRIEGLDVLRGLASLAVCWFHLTRFHYNSPDRWFYDRLRQSGAFGWLGVEMFFVISGFVIPYSLYRARYRIRDYFTYVLRRVVRLDPPYLAAIAVILLLAYGSTWHSGRSPEIEGQPIGWTRLLLHLGYLNAFSNYAWLNPGFWTLFIEVQYYLLMGLLFPLVVSRNLLVRLATLAVMGTTNVLFAAEFFPKGEPSTPFLPYILCLFLLGIVTFQFRIGLIRVPEYVLALVAVAGLSVLTLGRAPSVAGLAAVAVILAYAGKASVIAKFFAKISYSLYLLHWPIGHFTLSLLGLKFLRAESDVARTFVLFVALGVCLASAYLLYATVERPAQRWSARFRYGAHGVRLGLRADEATK